MLKRTAKYGFTEKLPSTIARLVSLIITLNIQVNRGYVIGLDVIYVHRYVCLYLFCNLAN